MKGLAFGSHLTTAHRGLHPVILSGNRALAKVGVEGSRITLSTREPGSFDCAARKTRRSLLRNSRSFRFKSNDSNGSVGLCAEPDSK